MILPLQSPGPSSVEILGWIVVLALLTVAVFGLFRLIGKVIRVAVVPEGQVWLHLCGGKFEARLPPGTHWFVGLFHDFQRMDLRDRRVVIAGQEILTKDNQGVRISLVVTHAIVDPEKAAFEVEDWSVALHQDLQVLLRRLVGEKTLDELLEQRPELGKPLTADIRLPAAHYGIDVKTVEVRDIMLPGDLRRAQAEIAIARRQGEAALERARGEQAALRNLANAARMLERNPALLSLRVLQTMSDPAARGNTFIIGGQGMDLSAAASASGEGETAKAPRPPRETDEW